jgi:ribosomal RNA assembly protein
LREDIFLEVINITDYVGGRKNRVQRMRGRLIGRQGRSRETIENLTETLISIQGDTVAIIGDPVELELARSGIDMLLRGSEHSAVFHFLERRQRELKFRELAYYGQPEWRDSDV